MNDYKFGNFLCSLREVKGLTQLEIANMLDVTPAAVSKWENGESKPRIETLFKLAEIFDVTAEELMSGEFIKKENDELDDASIKRYEYLSRIDRLLSSKVRMLRVGAFVIDWNIMGLPTIIWSLTAFILYPVQGVSPSESDIYKLFVGLIVFLFAWLVCFVLRDFIFKGRSPGKRIFGLIIVDRKSGGSPTKKQLILRNIFFFLQSMDGIIMLLRGVSIGDSVAQTLVLSKKELEENKYDVNNEINNINEYVPAKREKEKGVSIIGVWSCFIYCFRTCYAFFNTRHGKKRALSGCV